MSVEWQQNADGTQLVSSAAHLLQIMHMGSLYTDTGTPPTSYMSASYLQTSDIDLANHHASILPIGKSSSTFTGTYDGGQLAISNWSYQGTDMYTGLFGYCRYATLKHIRISGVWTLGSANFGGLIAGWMRDSTAYDIEGDLSSGTVIDGASVGGLIGSVNGVSVYGATLRGTVEFAGDTSRANVGGLFSSVFGNSIVSQCRNLATFPSGITGTAPIRVCGGITGLAEESTLDRCLNGMIGDIIGNISGGVCGKVTDTVVFDSVVNSMTGNIENLSSSSGGIVGYISLARDNKLVTLTRALNYMTGDLIGNNSGGILGYAGQSKTTSNLSITASVVAMNGSVPKSVVGTIGFVPTAIEVTMDTSFGLVYDQNDFGLATMVTDEGLLHDTTFADLPYFNMSGTDPAGNVYNWDFVFGNIGGKYPQYTHLSVHTVEVSAPYSTNFGLGTANEVVYLTYANVAEKSVYIDDSLTIVSTSAAIAYGRASLSVLYEAPLTKEVYFNARINAYDVSNGDAPVASVANALFNTGDRVVIDVTFKGKTAMTTTFVNRGDIIDVAEVAAVLVPFDVSIADTQVVTVRLSDDTLVEVSLDTVTGYFTVGGVTYTSGEHFVMDGKKVTVEEIY